MKILPQSPINFGLIKFVSNPTGAGEARADAIGESIAAAAWKGFTSQFGPKSGITRNCGLDNNQQLNTPSITFASRKLEFWGPK